MLTTRASLLAAFVLPFVGPLGRGNDDSMSTYLRTTGPTAAECFERPPGDLMGWIAERQHVGFGGTTGHEQTVVDLFYASYRETLRPAIDTRYPKARALREPLQKLHCAIFDFMSSITGDRTYITHDRIAAYTEHILAELYRDQSAVLLSAAKSHPTDEDVATFARLKASVHADNGRPMPDYDRYSADLLRHLKAAEAADPAIEARNLRFYVVDFIDRYNSVLLRNTYGGR